MSVFECLGYRDWIDIWLKSRPKQGHGELSKIARQLDVNSTLISQVLAGSRDFSLEQGHALCRYFAFNHLETRYFMLMLQAERAGTKDLRAYFESELKEIKVQAGHVKNRIETDTEISDTDKSFIVSTWRPGALLVFTGKEGGVTLDEIVDALKIEKEIARVLAEKLVEIGLISQNEGRFKTGLKRLHIPKGSSFLLRHYTNWRLKAIDRSENLSDDEVMYTSVSSIAASDVPKFKEKMLTWISEYAKSVSESPAEEVVCLNLDFFKI
jgi:hypothetical protein